MNKFVRIERGGGVDYIYNLLTKDLIKKVKLRQQK